ncbi:hypothetical protein LNQ49_12245 [Flavobacterium sp. F-65]|jgi:hypothetical protein|uniref:Uncharacterized protein n=1 Tax=Flavobacterium pisciphilum TaxID=2893755 RepID=A0ABS8MUB9_9FLAO|nr:hypothetical protein [Flavobacterium sp. F-65]MCC9072352.1 hypothetical protein [Flavobacterium sp. F-65]
MAAPLCKKIPYMLLFGLLITTNYTFAQEATTVQPIEVPVSSICTAVGENICSSSILELSTTNESIVELSVPMGSFAINSDVVNNSYDINGDTQSSFASWNNPVNTLDVNCKYDFSETFIDSLLFFDIDVIKERII